jgi:putative ABC transport system permease protein
MTPGGVVRRRRGIRLRLLSQGLRWRRGLAAAVLGVAVVTMTAAALGPLYARAAAESILQDHLRHAGTDAGISLHIDLDAGDPAMYAHYRDAALRPGTIRGFDRVIAGLYTAGVATYVPRAPLGAVSTHLVWRDGQCAHLVIVTGRCPVRPGEAIASARIVASGIYHWRLGTRISLDRINEADNPNYTEPVPTPAPVHVVGTYRPVNVHDGYWFGQDYFQWQGSAVAGADTVDSLFVARSEFTSLRHNSYVEAFFDYPLTSSEVRLDDVATVRAQVGHLLATDHGGRRLVADSELPAALKAAAHERHLVNVATLLVTVQLALLAWMTLFQVVADAIEARGGEIAIAKLRGHPPWSFGLFGLAEPLALIAVAVPIGLVAALGFVHLFAMAVLVHGIPIVLPAAAVGTCLLGFAGGVMAAGLAGYRTLTRSVLEQWRRTERRPGHGWAVFAVDVAAAAAALVGLAALLGSRAAGRSDDTAALLAPGLLVLAVALLGVRLLPVVCRRLARGTRATRRIGLFLASRQVARRPVGLRLAAFLAVAVGLAAFAVAGETIASGNRSARAAGELGATQVASVLATPGHNPVVATREVDPNGRWAMAAATWLPDGGAAVTGTVLAVDASRLAAVASHTSGAPGNGQLADAIGAAAVAPIAVTGTQVRVHLTASDLVGGEPPTLQLNLRTSRQPYLNVNGAPIRQGAHAYLVTVPCAAGCVLRGLTWDRPITAERGLSGVLTLTGVDTRRGTRWSAVDLGLHTAASWYAARSVGQATDIVVVTPSGIRDRFSNANGGYGGITSGADPSPIPAVATPAGVVGGPNSAAIPSVVDGIGTTATVHVVRTVGLLPVVLTNGVLMDVRYLQDELPGFAGEANWQIWLGPGAPANALTRLAAAGLQVQGVSNHRERVDELARQAPALALLLLLACASAGAVLAVGGTAVSVAASSRRRSYEVAALGTVGLTRRALTRAALAEQLLLLGGAVLLGVPTGLIAARLAMPAIPEFATSTPIAMRYTPHLLPAAALIGCVAALLLISARVAAHSLMRIAVPTRLRDAE